MDEEQMENVGMKLNNTINDVMDRYLKELMEAEEGKDIIEKLTKKGDSK